MFLSSIAEVESMQFAHPTQKVNLSSRANSRRLKLVSSERSSKTNRPASTCSFKPDGQSKEHSRTVGVSGDCLERELLVEERLGLVTKLDSLKRLEEELSSIYGSLSSLRSQIDCYFNSEVEYETKKVMEKRSKGFSLSESVSSEPTRGTLAVMSKWRNLALAAMFSVLAINVLQLVSTGAVAIYFAVLGNIAIAYQLSKLLVACGRYWLWHLLLLIAPIWGYSVLIWFFQPALITGLSILHSSVLVVIAIILATGTACKSTKVVGKNNKLAGSLDFVSSLKKLERKFGLYNKKFQSLQIQFDRSCRDLVQAKKTKLGQGYRALQSLSSTADSIEADRLRRALEQFQRRIVLLEQELIPKTKSLVEKEIDGSITALCQKQDEVMCQLLRL